ncbi:MAG: hypothetical protein ACYTG1_07140 [Planctomycetota bacterium]|jgi:hypothetical protein
MNRFGIPTSGRLAGLALVLVTATALTMAWSRSARSQAEDGIAFNYWGAAGSTGTIDESDRDLYNTRGAKIQVQTAAATPAVLNVRYSVVPVENLVDPAGPVVFLQLLYKDNGDDARVVAKLKEYNVETGDTTVRLVFDSDDFEAAGSLQRNFVLEEEPLWAFDFTMNAYFVDVAITKGSAGAKPSVGMIQVGTL